MKNNEALVHNRC